MSWNVLTILDELLDTVGNVKLAILCYIKDIASLVPAVRSYVFFVEFRLLPIPLEDIRALEI